ncbi:MAG: efflux RND transporter periplasmic adaptor subunit [Candidatus Marinimicrobia bacterium]|nr:efflux RND transporter periplasmic adaptor subunit [Candidatus Neomarinimicrobiota bacterium]
MKYQIFSKSFFVLLLLSIMSCGENDNKEAIASNIESTSDETKVVPVEVMVVSKQNLEATIPFTGILAPSRSVDIISEVSGKVQKINMKLGQRVSTKDVLAVIDDEVPYNQFQQAQAQKLAADNSLKIAQLNLESDKILFDNDDISKIAFENSVLAVKNAEANQLAAIANLSLLKKNFNNTRIKSPIPGIISRKHIELGTMVSIGMPIYRVVDLSYLKIEIGISQDMVNFVQVGSQASVQISALNNQSFSGKVRYISPQAEEQTGTFKAEIHVTNTQKMEIRAGMTASVELAVSNEGKQLSVPNYALVTKNSDQSIYKISGNIAELHKIEIGQSIGSRTIVNFGLAEGDTIVVVGMKNLGEKTSVFVESVN